MLDGPNLYFPRAAIKLTLDLTPAASTRRARWRCGSRRGSGCASARPGRGRAAASGSGSRPAPSPGWCGRSRPRPAPPGSAVRVRPDHRRAPGRRGVPVAAPRPGPRRSAGPSPRCSTRCRAADVDDAGRRGRRGGARPPSPGPGPHDHPAAGPGGRGDRDQRQDHDVADDRATSRRVAGLHVGWSCTDGIYVDGELVEAGRLLRARAVRAGCWPTRQVQLAVTETARGGILLKGIGVACNDVSVVTNVSRRPPRAAGHRHPRPARRGQGRRPADHQADGLGGAQRRRPARLRDARGRSGRRPWVFSRDPDSPAIREMLDDGGRATTVIDGWVCVLRPARDPDPLVERGRRPDDAGRAVPVQRRERAGRGLGRAGGRPAARGRRRGAARRSARTPSTTPGRMNIFTSADGGHAWSIDLAHNEAGLEALLEIMTGVRPPGARLLLGLGAVGRPQRRDRRARSARSAPATPTWSRSRTRRSTCAGRTTERARRAVPGAARRRSGSTDVAGVPDRGGRAWRRWSARPTPGDVVGADVPPGPAGRSTTGSSRHGATVDSPEDAARQGAPRAPGAGLTPRRSGAARLRIGAGRPGWSRDPVRRVARPPVAANPAWAWCDQVSSSAITAACLSTQTTTRSPGLARAIACRTASISSRTTSTCLQRAPVGHRARARPRRPARPSRRARGRAGWRPRGRSTTSKCWAATCAELAHVLVAAVARGGDDADPRRLGRARWSASRRLADPVHEVAEHPHAGRVVAVVDDHVDAVDLDLVEAAGGEVVVGREGAQPLPDVVQRAPRRRTRRPRRPGSSARSSGPGRRTSRAAGGSRPAASRGGRA